MVKRIEGQFKDVKAEVASVEQGVKAIYIAKMLPKTEDDLEKFLCTPIFELIDIEVARKINPRTQTITLTWM